MAAIVRSPSRPSRGVRPRRYARAAAASWTSWQWTKRRARFPSIPRGGYFSGQSYTLRLELQGYKPTEIELTPKMSGWYWGNLLIGGLIGMLAVDPATGAMWNIAPDKIDRKLANGQSAMIKNETGFLVVLEADLTPAEREHMVRLN